MEGSGGYRQQPFGEMCLWVWKRAGDGGCRCRCVWSLHTWKPQIKHEIQLCGEETCKVARMLKKKSDEVKVVCLSFLGCVVSFLLFAFPLSPPFPLITASLLLLSLYISLRDPFFFLLILVCLFGEEEWEGKTEGEKCGGTCEAGASRSPGDTPIQDNKRHLGFT